MKFAIHPDRIIYHSSFNDEYELDKNQTIALELSDVEVDILKRLINHNLIKEDYLPEISWYFDRAKVIAQEESQIQILLDNFRESIYTHPQRFHEVGKQKGKSDSESQKMWAEAIKEEQSKSEDEKGQRDRKLYQDLKGLHDILEFHKYASSITFNFTGKNEKTINNIVIASESLIQTIQESLKSIDIEEVRMIINIIGENSNSETKIKGVRKSFIKNFYIFLKSRYDETLSEYKYFQVIAGVMFFAGLKRPTNQNYPLDYTIGSSNEEYIKYIKGTLIRTV